MRKPTLISRRSSTSSGDRRILRERRSSVRYEELTEEDSLDSTDLNRKPTLSLTCDDDVLADITLDCQSPCKTEARIELPKRQKQSLRRHNSCGKLSVTSCESEDSGVNCQHDGSSSPPLVKIPCTVELESCGESGLELARNRPIGPLPYIECFKLIDDFTTDLPPETSSTRTCLQNKRVYSSKRKRRENNNIDITTQPEIKSLKRSGPRPKSPPEMISKIRKKPKRQPERSQTRLHRPRSPRVRPKRAKVEMHKRNGCNSLLKRLQHHNQSPERPAGLPQSKGKSCRTRSQKLSLLNVHCEFKSPVKSASRGGMREARSRRPVLTLETASQCSSSTNSSPEKLMPRGMSKCTKGLKRGCSNEGSEDSGLASDDQSSSDCFRSACRWRFCKSEVSDADLADHIQRVHVASQKRNSEVYRCYWEDCKVYGQIAKSLIWLEGHVKKHLGSQPYYCIFGGCSRRFSSQELLQKHVDSHINQSEQPKAGKKIDPSSKKEKKSKNIKRLRGTEKCIPKRSEFFTANIIDAVHWEQVVLHEKWGRLLNEERSALSMHGQIVSISRNLNTLAERVQLKWFPEELNIPDSWHDKDDEVVKTRTKLIKISDIPRQTLLFS